MIKKKRIVSEETRRKIGIANTGKHHTNETKQKLSLLLTGRPSNSGSFKQIRKLWSLNNFNDGYIDNKNRFRVWMPNHPRAYNEGYILRATVAYEAYHGVNVPKEMDIHHKDKNQLNDSIENLEMILHGKHTVLHKTDLKLYANKKCENCGKEFKIRYSRLKDATHKGRFCSPKCYYEYPKSIEQKKKHSLAMKKRWSTSTLEERQIIGKKLVESRRNKNG